MDLKSNRTTNNFMKKKYINIYNLKYQQKINNKVIKDNTEKNINN